MAYREIERLDDIETILKADGSEWGKRAYHLTVYENRIDVGHGETIAGMPRIQGRIVLHGMEGARLLMDGETLTLRLADGRRLPFFFTNDSGTIAPRGSLE